MIGQFLEKAVLLRRWIDMPKVPVIFLMCKMESIIHSFPGGWAS